MTTDDLTRNGREGTDAAARGGYLGEPESRDGDIIFSLCERQDRIADRLNRKIERLDKRLRKMEERAGV